MDTWLSISGALHVIRLGLISGRCWSCNQLISYFDTWSSFPAKKKYYYLFRFGYFVSVVVYLGVQLFTAHPSKILLFWVNNNLLWVSMANPEHHFGEGELLKCLNWWTFFLLIHPKIFPQVLIWWEGGGVSNCPIWWPFFFSHIQKFREKWCRFFTFFIFWWGISAPPEPPLRRIGWETL